MKYYKDLKPADGQSKYLIFSIASKNCWENNKIYISAWKTYDLLESLPVL